MLRHVRCVAVPLTGNKHYFLENFVYSPFTTGKQSPLKGGEILRYRWGCSALLEVRIEIVEGFTAASSHFIR